MRQYIGLIHKEPGSDFGVSFPDFPGCVTAGSTLDESRAMAEEALAFHVEGMIEDGETIPEPSTLEQVIWERGNRDAVAILVGVQTRVPKVVRVNVTFPEDILARIDRFAQARGLTRSGLLATAARRLMETDAA